MPPEDRSDQGQTANLAHIAGMGTELVSAILAGGGIGWLLDYWLGTRPTALIVGLILGILVGGVAFIRSALLANKAASDRYARSHSRRERIEGDDAND